MKTERTTARDIDEYIAGFPEEAREALEQIRATIREVVPEAKETISYQIPTFVLNRNLIHFAAFKNHIGVYPVPRGNAEFAEELSAYKGGKGTAQFPLGKPLPLDLIRRIVAFRVQEDLERASTKT